jgi:uncharacterized membrane protein YfcA
MRETQLTFPEIALIAGTRGMLGAGLGLLLADRLPGDQRRAVGWTLLLVGILTTFPLVADVLSKRVPAQSTGWTGQDGREAHRRGGAV